MKLIKLILIEFFYFLENVINNITLFFYKNYKEVHYYKIFMFLIKIFVTFVFKFIYYSLNILLLFLMSIKYLTSFDNRYFTYFTRLSLQVFFFIIFIYFLTFKEILYLFIFIYLFFIIKYIYKNKPKSIIHILIILNSYITSKYLKMKDNVISMIKLL